MLNFMYEQKFLYNIWEDDEYIQCTKDILNHEQFQRLNNYIQHGTTTCLVHSVNVSYQSYLYCRQHGLNWRNAARGGLLHDLFLYDWHYHFKETGNRFHGLTHPKSAYRNAVKFFHLNKVEKDIIIKHMWPLTVIPPKYKESAVVCMMDKYCSTMETVRPRLMFWRTGQVGT